MPTSRLEAFSDGVFAIAITLLILNLHNPDVRGDLPRELLRQWPDLAAYAVSFAVIGILWINHHTTFRHVARTDRPLLLLNLLLLLFVAFLPYPTGLFGEALRLGAGTRTAAFFYSVAMTLIAFSYTALWLYISVGRRLLTDAYPEARRRSATRRFGLGSVAYPLTLGIALLGGTLCLVVHGALAVFYAFDQLATREDADP